MTRVLRSIGVLTITGVLAGSPAQAQMTQAWVQAREGMPSRLVQAPDGDLIVAATLIVPSTIGGSAFHDSVIARYSPEGQLRWIWQSGEPQDELLHDLGVDPAGNIYAVGEIGTSFYGQAPFATRLMKFSSDGQRQWSTNFSPARAGFSAPPKGVRVSPDGSVYIFGQESGATTQRDIYVARYSASGSHQWTFRRAGPVWDWVWDLTFDTSANAYWVGSTFREGTTLNGACVGKLRPSGQQDWIWLQPVVPGTGGDLRRVSLDHNGDIVAVGYSEDFPGFQDGVVVKLTPDGHQRFLTFWDGPDARWDRFYTHAVLSDNSIATSGITYAGDGPEYYDIPTTRFSPQGSVLWSDIYGSTLFYPDDTEELSHNMFSLPGDEILTVSTDWSRPGYDFALHHYTRDGQIIEHSVQDVLTGDVKEIPANRAVYDPDRHALFLLAWGTGFVSNPVANCSALIRVDLADPAPPCPADLDDGRGTGAPDGGITIDDLVYFLAQFESGTAHADLDDGSGTGTRDGGVTIDDLVYFLTRFQGGC